MMEPFGESPEEETKEEIKEEIKEEKPKTLAAVGTKLENVRMTVVNWLLIVAAFGAFLGATSIVGTSVQDKGWIFWVSLIALALFVASILAGTASHICHVGAVAVPEDKAYGWDQCSIISLWTQMAMFFVGMLLILITTVTFYATFSVPSF